MFLPLQFTKKILIVFKFWFYYCIKYIQVWHIFSRLEFINNSVSLAWILVHIYLPIFNENRFLLFAYTYIGLFSSQKIKTKNNNFSFIIKKLIIIINKNLKIVLPEKMSYFVSFFEIRIKFRKYGPLNNNKL